MSRELNILQSYSKTQIPERLQKFYSSEMEPYSESTIDGIPGWDHRCEFELDFSAYTLKELISRHNEWLKSGSVEDKCEYIPFSTLSIEDDSMVDFLAINISKEDCPVYYGDHETGGFSRIARSLDNFLINLGDQGENPFDIFMEIYNKAKDAYFEDNNPLVIKTLGENFFDKFDIDPARPTIYIKEFPKALNLLGCAYYEMDQLTKAMETLNKACTAIFCKDAFLNRIKLNILCSNYEEATKQCDFGLMKFTDSFSQSFLHLYLGIIKHTEKNEEKALLHFSKMRGNVEKTHSNSIIPVALTYTHMIETKDFEKTFNEVSKLTQNNL